MVVNEKLSTFNSVIFKILHYLFKLHIIDQAQSMMFPTTFVSE